MGTLIPGVNQDVQKEASEYLLRLSCATKRKDRKGDL
jgi:hypothetical protein